MELLEKKSIKYGSVNFSRENGFVKLMVDVEVKNIKELSSLMREINRIKGISSVVRNFDLNKKY
jgi:(p)ppGpp synthase/HD superfamily hydrolase